MNKRTSFITAGAVTGVLLAGTAAVGANIGILNAADNGNVGELSAASAMVATPDAALSDVEPQVIDIYLDEPVGSTPATTVPAVTTPEATTQEFAVDVAGTVTVAQTETGVLLDGVVVAEGWTWTSTQPADGELAVTFTSAGAEFVFYASLGQDGTIAARVDEPIVRVVQAPAAPSSNSGSSSASTPAPSNTAPSAGYDDDDHDDEDHEDDGDHGGDDDHDDDHGDDVHEGGGDDD